MTYISLALKKASPIEVPLYLYQLQKRALELWKANFSLIDTKNGWTRGKVLGGEFNYSGRSVIILDPTLKLDEVDMPYKAFLEQYKGRIIKRIMKDKGWSLTKARNFLSERFNYDPYVYKVMCDIVDEEHPEIILNRNPKPYGVVKLL